MRVYVYALYFCLGPIYWLPLIDKNLLDVLKLFLFSMIMSDIIWRCISLKYIKKINIFLGFLYMALIGLFVSFISHGGENFDINPVVSIILPILIMTTAVYGESRDEFQIVDAIKLAPLLFSFFAAFVPIGLFVPSLNFQNPFYDETNWQFSQTYTGFGGSRTGWSFGASFLAAAALANIITAKNWLRIINSLAFITIIASVAIPGGRGGMLAITTMVVTLIFTGFYLKKNYISFLILILIFSLMMVFGYKYSEELRLTLLFSGDASIASSGRTEGYNIGISLIGENLFFGSNLYDVDLKNYGFEYSQIHNSVINYAVKFGIIASLPIIFLFLAFYFSIFKIKRTELQQWYFIFFILSLNGVAVLTLLEPTSVFGNYHNTLIFWFSVIIFLNKNSKYTVK